MAPYTLGPMDLSDSCLSKVSKTLNNSFQKLQGNSGKTWIIRIQGRTDKFSEASFIEMPPLSARWRDRVAKLQRPQLLALHITSTSTSKNELLRFLESSTVIFHVCGIDASLLSEDCKLQLKTNYLGRTEELELKWKRAIAGGLRHLPSLGQPLHPKARRRISYRSSSIFIPVTGTKRDCENFKGRILAVK